VTEQLGRESCLPHLAELDRRLIECVRDVRLLAAVSWPVDVQHAFLARYRRGQAKLPEVAYPILDFTEVKAELTAILRASAVFEGHPVADYVHRTASSFHTTTLLLESLGTQRVTTYSIDLFGRPGFPLPGTTQSNLDAARHFILLADEVMPSLAENEASYVLSAETVKHELESRIVKFFTRHKVRVEIDPTLTAKAAAGPTRIRLRANTGFTEYDWHQLLEHEAFVHSLTALNGRDQPNLSSLGLTSARITATQEGLATFAELITGSIDIARMKRISLRIEAIHMALGGADFIQVYEFFKMAGQSNADSFTSAMRVYRGVPLTGGQAFTKDTVYLHGLLSVHTFFRWALKHRKFNLCRNLCAGKMTLGDAVRLEPWFDSGYIAPPAYLPPWLQRANGLAGVLAFSLFANRIRLDRVIEEDLVLGD